MDNEVLMPIGVEGLLLGGRLVHLLPVESEDHKRIGLACGDVSSQTTAVEIWAQRTTAVGSMNLTTVLQLDAKQSLVCTNVSAI